MIAIQGIYTIPVIALVLAAFVGFSPAVIVLLVLGAFAAYVTSASSS